MVLEEEKDCPALPSSTMHGVGGSGKKPQVRPRSIANGNGFPAVAPRNGKLVPSLSSEDGDTDSASSSVQDEYSPSTPSIMVETGGRSNGFDPHLEVESRDAGGNRRGNVDDDANDVKLSESAEHKNGCDKTEEDDGQEDVYGLLAEQIQRSEEHVPLHRSVCCALCRKKEQRVRKRMQEQRSFSCPDSSETPETSEYINEGTPTFATVSNADLNPMLLLRPPDTVAGGFQWENDDPSPYSSLFHRSVKSDDLFHNDFQQMGLNGDIPSNENCHQCTDSTCVKLENGSAVNSTNTSDNPKKPNLDDVKTQRGEKPRSVKRQEQLPENQVQENGGDRTSNFKRRASLRGNSVSDERSNPNRRFDSFRVQRDPAAEPQPISDPVLLQKLRDTTGLQSSELKLSPKDQKMLSVLLAKKEQERQLQLRRESSYLRRTGEKRNSTASSSSSSTSSSSSLRRQFSLNEPRGRENHVVSKQALQSSRSLDYESQEASKGHHSGQHPEQHCCDPDPEHECCSRYSKSAVTSPGKDHVFTRQHSREHCCHGDDEEHKCCSRYAASLMNSTTDKNQNSKKQLQQALERKKQVEQHLKEQKQKTEKYLTQLKEKKEQEQQRALATRQEKARRLAERSRVHNLQANQKLKEVKESKKMTMEELMAVHEEKQAHLTAAELKVRQLRENEKAKIESEIRRKLERSQEKQQQLEEELKRWQTELLEYRQLQETNAQSLAQATLAKKKEALAKERETKERQQKENLTRMLERESEWRAELEASIQSKDARSKMIQEEKEQMIKRSREAALTSRRIRQELHLNLSMTDLDLLVTRPE